MLLQGGGKPTILGIDLASRYSAAVLLAGGGVVSQFDSVGMTAGEFALRIRLAAQDADLIVLEDLPPRIPWASVVKNVCRLQGRILQVLEVEPSMIDKVWFVPPAQWQRSFEGVFRGKAAGAKAAAEVVGYEAPDLRDDPRFVAEGRSKSSQRQLAKKVMSDYVDAFLIAYWAATVDLAEISTVHQGAHL